MTRVAAARGVARVAAHRLGALGARAQDAEFMRNVTDVRLIRAELSQLRYMTPASALQSTRPRAAFGRAASRSAAPRRVRRGMTPRAAAAAAGVASHVAIAANGGGRGP